MQFRRLSTDTNNNSTKFISKLVARLFLCFSLLPYFHPSAAEFLYPASSLKLERLAEQEEIGYGILKKCWQHLTNVQEIEHYKSGYYLGLIYQYLGDYETSSGILLAAEDRVHASAAVAWNPLASLRMLDRFVSLLAPMAVSSFPCAEYREFITKFRQTMRWPNALDVEENISRILRLQQVYSLQAEDLAQGLLGTISTNIALSSWQTYQLGLVAFKNQFYTFAYQWLELTLKTINKSMGIVMQQRVSAALQHVIEKHDQTWSNDTMDFRTQYHFHELLNPNQGAPKPMTRRDVIARDFKEDYEVNYWKLCSGETLKSPEELSKLSCWLERKKHPFLVLAPLKMELLSLSPTIVRVYEILGNDQIEKIISSSKDSMATSNVYAGPQQGQVQINFVRSSIQTTLTDLHSPELKFIPRGIEVATGLNVLPVGSSEDLQVLAYSFGGHYIPHVDCLQFSERYGNEMGDRIATFMYYLSDVEAGGKTAFTTAGVAAEPIKGSAVFWFDLKKDASCDNPGTMHGGCPVIIGRKYERLNKFKTISVGNKWIRYNNQFKDWKCGLAQNEDYLVKMNGVLTN